MEMNREQYRRAVKKIPQDVRVLIAMCAERTGIEVEVFVKGWLYSHCRYLSERRMRETIQQIDAGTLEIVE